MEALEARNVSNRRWSASVASAEPAGRNLRRPALQGLNKDCCSALAELSPGVMFCRRFRFALPTVIYVTRLRRLHDKMKLKAKKMILCFVKPHQKQAVKNECICVLSVLCG